MVSNASILLPPQLHPMQFNSRTEQSFSNDNSNDKDPYVESLRHTRTSSGYIYGTFDREYETPRSYKEYIGDFVSPRRLQMKGTPRNRKKIEAKTIDQLELEQETNQNGNYKYNYNHRSNGTRERLSSSHNCQRKNRYSHVVHGSTDDKGLHSSRSSRRSMNRSRWRYPSRQRISSSTLTGLSGISDSPGSKETSFAGAGLAYSHEYNLSSVGKHLPSETEDSNNECGYNYTYNSANGSGNENGNDNGNRHGDLDTEYVDGKIDLEDFKYMVDYTTVKEIEAQAEAEAQRPGQTDHESQKNGLSDDYDYDNDNYNDNDNDGKNDHNSNYTVASTGKPSISSFDSTIVTNTVHGSHFRKTESVKSVSLNVSLLQKILGNDNSNDLYNGFSSNNYDNYNNYNGHSIDHHGIAGDDANSMIYLDYLKDKNDKQERMKALASLVIIFMLVIVIVCKNYIENKAINNHYDNNNSKMEDKNNANSNGNSDDYVYFYDWLVIEFVSNVIGIIPSFLLCITFWKCSLCHHNWGKSMFKLQRDKKEKYSYAFHHTRHGLMMSFRRPSTTKMANESIPLRAKDDTFVNSSNRNLFYNDQNTNTNTNTDTNKHKNKNNRLPQNVNCFFCFFSVVAFHCLFFLRFFLCFFFYTVKKFVLFFCFFLYSNQKGIVLSNMFSPRFALSKLTDGSENSPNGDIDPGDVDANTNSNVGGRGSYSTIARRVLQVDQSANNSFNFSSSNGENNNSNSNSNGSFENYNAARLSVVTDDTNITNRTNITNTANTTHTTNIIHISTGSNDMRTDNTYTGMTTPVPNDADNYNDGHDRIESGDNYNYNYNFNNKNSESVDHRWSTFTNNNSCGIIYDENKEDTSNNMNDNNTSIDKSDTRSKVQIATATATATTTTATTNISSIIENFFTASGTRLYNFANPNNDRNSGYNNNEEIMRGIHKSNEPSSLMSSHTLNRHSFEIVYPPQRSIGHFARKTWKLIVICGILFWIYICLIAYSIKMDNKWYTKDKSDANIDDQEPSIFTRIWTNYTMFELYNVFWIFIFRVLLFRFKRHCCCYTIFILVSVLGIAMVALTAILCSVGGGDTKTHDSWEKFNRQEYFSNFDSIDWIYVLFRNFSLIVISSGVYVVYIRVINIICDRFVFNRSGKIISLLKLGDIFVVLFLQYIVILIIGILSIIGIDIILENGGLNNCWDYVWTKVINNFDQFLMSFDEYYVILYCVLNFVFGFLLILSVSLLNSLFVVLMSSVVVLVMFLVETIFEKNTWMIQYMSCMGIVLVFLSFFGFCLLYLNSFAWFRDTIKSFKKQCFECRMHLCC